MNSIEIKIADQKLVLKGDEAPEHLEEVADLVRRRVDTIVRKNPTISLQKAGLLAALDFASHLIKGQRQAAEYRSAVVAKTSLLLDRVELELGGK